jgi:hypothetical protein
MDTRDLYLNISYPLSQEVQISFDCKRATLTLEGKIFVSENMADSVIRYVEARKNHFFNPYKTFFLQRSDQKISLIQEIPLKSSSLREEIMAFQEQMKRAHRLLFEIALEEHLEKAINF